LSGRFFLFVVAVGVKTQTAFVMQFAVWLLVLAQSSTQPSATFALSATIILPF
jgi:hypothetical protein